MATINRLGCEKPVVIFSRSTCGICYTIKTLISNFGANTTIYELDKHPDGERMERELAEMGRNPTAPTVFIGKEMVGGSDEIITLNIRGRLKPLLIEAKAIWV